MSARILVVDDDASLAEMLTIVLQGEGFETTVVGDGTGALPALRESSPDLVLGLESGADDYVVKPFKPKELVARIRARLRQFPTEPAEQMQIGDVTIDVPAHQVRRGGRTIPLTPLEFDLLVALARKPRQVFTREGLLEQVWGNRPAAGTRPCNAHIQRTRA